ncbi:PHP domain-containing protein [endosymbiont GvMRE of Glomus versiforme]|uniref:PHP domain-containing protein n=1 Tax=endosymbiont GvMRE of Glomus versiforme TaxID=2039283 RepID=UPI000ED5F116|nr:PHP domain-containing protein [endosymbiont GvMRE of Glomus versiforme]RHZ35580.1 DNA-directed DNA polymerase [endosymbiont GvMRE of Glomus versiforme]
MKRFFLPHLNTQTNSNLSFSFLKVSELANWASEKQLSYLAIADYHPYEIIEFFSFCKAKKIKPIWGIKIFFQEKPEEEKYSATIYPQNNKGYKEVLQKLFSPDSPNDRTFSLNYILSNLSKNCLVVLEARKIEEIKHFAAEWILTRLSQKEINYNNLFIGFNFFLLAPSQSIPPKVIPLLLPFFSIKCLTFQEIGLLSLWRKTNFNRYFFPSDTYNTFLHYLNTDDYFSHCTDDKAFYQLLLVQWQAFLIRIKLNPSFRREKLSETKKENSLLLLKSKCWQKLISLKKQKEGNYQKILEEELIVIEKLDYSDYLLVFSDVVNYLKTKNIMVGPGRGSAVSSLVVYLLEITSVDPLQHKLFFERFLNEERKSLPDIDLDVEDQTEIFNYLQQKYPKNQVARIVTKEKIGWKNSLKEAGKICGIGELVLGEIISITGKNPDFGNLKLQKWQLSYPIFFALVEKINNLYYNNSIHPAGVIITENSLTGLVPLKHDKNYILALFEAEKLNYLGLKKYDFLSLKETFSFVNFSFIREVKEFLKLNLPSYQDINFEDEKTWELFSNFLLADIFQLDTPSARELLIKFRPQNFSDLIIFLGLNRPGARARAQEISQARNTKKKLNFSSPIIREILNETYGFIIFEEQISQIFVFVYECSFAEAEIKRRGLAEKGLGKDFLTKAEKKMPSFESNLLYNQIISAIGYTFNKAHAVAYGYLTYYISYLKANFFPEIIVHLLNEKRGDNLPRLQEAFFYGFRIKGPDINHSEINWVKSNNKELIMGLNNSKECRTDFFEKIIIERKEHGIYKNWENFLDRTFHYWENIENNILEAWVKSGLFTSLQIDIDTLLENKESILRYLQIKKKLSNTNKDLPFLHLPVKKIEENTTIINKREYENLGLYVSYFSRWKELFQKTNDELHSLLEIFQKIEKYNNRKTLIKVYAIIYQIKKKDENNHELLLQDVKTSFKLNINKSIYQLNKKILLIHSELLFDLSIKVKEGKIYFLACEKISNV